MNESASLCLCIYNLYLRLNVCFAMFMSLCVDVLDVVCVCRVF